MNDHEIRIAIAEACGWRRVWVNNPRHIVQWVIWRPDGVCDYCDPDPNAKWEVHRLPDYPKDLNAMHEAEKVLSPSESRLYADMLSEITATGPVDFGDVVFAGVHATARQRAEAFLRAIGKWRDRP